MWPPWLGAGLPTPPTHPLLGAGLPTPPTRRPKVSSLQPRFGALLPTTLLGAGLPTPPKPRPQVHPARPPTKPITLNLPLPSLPRFPHGKRPLPPTLRLPTSSQLSLLPSIAPRIPTSK